jgi:hypothetical protein
MTVLFSRLLNSPFENVLAQALLIIAGKRSVRSEVLKIKVSRILQYSFRIIFASFFHQIIAC